MYHTLQVLLYFCPHSLEVFRNEFLADWQKYLNFEVILITEFVISEKNSVNFVSSSDCYLITENADNSVGGNSFCFPGDSLVYH